MTKFLKNVDRVRSLVRGMEADVKEMEKASNKSFNKIKTRVNKKLEELSGEITTLYGFLDDSTLYLLHRSGLELDRRRTTIEDFEKAQRLIENKLSLAESSSKSFQSTSELLAKEDKTLDELITSAGNIKMQANGMNSELNSHNSLLTEIDNEVGANLGMLDNGMKKLGLLANYTSDTCLMVTICLLCFLLLMILMN